MAPVLRELHERRFGVLEGVGHIVAEHPAQRGKQGSEALQIDLALAVDRYDGLPRQVIAQQTFERIGILGGHGFLPVHKDVAGKPHHLTHALAAAIERPFVAVGVADVGNGREAPPLIAVAPGEALDVRAGARSLDLDVAGQELVEVDGVVGAAEAVGQVRLAGTHDIPAQCAGSVSHEILEGAPQLVLRLAVGELSHLGLDSLGEGPEGFLDRHSLDYVRITLPARAPQRRRRPPPRLGNSSACPAVKPPAGTAPSSTRGISKERPHRALTPPSSFGTASTRSPAAPRRSPPARPLPPIRKCAAPPASARRAGLRWRTPAD